VEEARVPQPIYHKNLERLVYVFGETAGRPPAEAILEMQDAVARDSLLEPFEIEWAGEGEWKITLDVFRDLGIAFGVAVLGIYMLLVYQTHSYLMPLVLLIAIPLTVIGIVPGFYLLNLLASGLVDGFADPVYFTATAMIGMIALAGIATRNAILLMEFVEEARRRGRPMRQALIEAGALRTRPIFLTAGTALLAAWPITLDPIFSGLAWALIFGLLVSTVFTLVVVPVVYSMIYARGES
jgi:multidrug efflux pump subunit AcrB